MKMHLLNILNHFQASEAEKLAAVEHFKQHKVNNRKFYNKYKIIKQKLYYIFKNFLLEITIKTNTKYIYLLIKSNYIKFSLLKKPQVLRCGKIFSFMCLVLHLIIKFST
jgi:hypothetical protein